MAKFLPGPTVAEVRGSIGGVTYTRNRYGAIMRTRVKPTVSTTEFATAAKARMTAATQAWQSLTAARQLAWNQWANATPVIGALGEQQILTGHVAWVGNFCRRRVIGGTPPTDPPITAAPAPLITMSFVPNKTGGTCDITFTATPLAAATHLWVRATQQPSAGKVWVENLLKGGIVSAAAQASPFDAITGTEARIGALVVGQILHITVAAFDYSTGLLSAPLRGRETII